MIRMIDLEDAGLTIEQVRNAVNDPAGAALRVNGHVIARLEPADDLDVESEDWARQPEQVARGDAARQRLANGQARTHDQVMRELGLADESTASTGQ